MALINFFTARDGMEAHFLRSMLDEHDIEAVVVGETLGTADGHTPHTPAALPQVWLDDSVLDKALPLLDKFMEIRTHHIDLDAPADPWVCDACEEEIEGQFSACWQCGALRIIEDEGVLPTQADRLLDEPESAE